MAYYCQQFNIWVEETIEQPVESWVNETREKCEEQECNWWVLCLNKIVCWTVVVTVKVISYVLITVPKMITVFVCELVSMPVIFIISEIQPALCFLGINFPSSNNFDLSLAIKLAKVSLTVYQEENEADFTEIDPNFEVVDFFQFQGFNFGNIYTDTQVYILKDSSTSTLIVGFRGSQPNFPDWFNDLSAIPFPYFPGSMGTLLHAGFLGAYNTIRKDLITVLLTKIAEEGIEQIYFTGHSLGGALATVASYDFKLLISQNITIKTYTYGAPKVGNVYFAYDYNGFRFRSCLPPGDL